MTDAEQQQPSALDQLHDALTMLPEERSAQITVTIESDTEIAAEWHDDDAWTYVSVRDDDTMFLVHQQGSELVERVVPFDGSLLRGLLDGAAAV